MPRLLFNAWLTTVGGLVAFAGHAAEFEVLSARQADRGSVVVTVALQAAGVPQPSDLILQLDNAAPVRASAVTPADTPAAPAWLMVCLDRSGSIGPMALEGLKVGLRQALVERREGHLPYQVAIIAFATRTTHLLDFTSDPAQVEAAIQRLVIDASPAGSTLMYDAIAGGLAALKAQGDGSKRLIVVSDGKDEGSATPPAALTALVQGPPRITIDALALGALAQDHSGAISTLAGSSGGRFLPSPDLNDVAQPLRRLIAEAVPPSHYHVAFVYDPATNERTAGSAALAYAPEGAVPARRVLQAGLAAPNVPDAKAQDGADVTITFELVMNWLREAPAYLLWLAAALLAAALALSVQRLRRPPNEVSVVNESVRVDAVIASGAAPAPAPRVRRPTAVGPSWQAPAPGQPVAILRGVSGAGRGHSLAVDNALFRVGCNPDNDLVLLGDDFASGAHALLRFEAGSLYVEDLGSTNGSHLNGGHFRSATRSLAPGDELRFGRTTYTVLAPEPGRTGRSGHEPAPG